MSDFKDVLFHVHHISTHQKHYALIIAKMYIDGNFTLSLTEEDITINLDANPKTISLVYRLSTNGSIASEVNRLVTIFKHVEIIDAKRACTEPSEVRADIGDKLYDITCQVKKMNGDPVSGPKTGTISQNSTIIID